MSKTPSSTSPWAREGNTTQLPPGGTLPLAANEKGGQGQLLAFNASGYVFLIDGTIPGVVAAGVGWPGKISESSPVDKTAYISVWTGFGAHTPVSTESGDDFTAADQCVPAWGADENTLGKKSNLSGTNRPLMGIVFGVNDDNKPRSWIGPVAQAIARALLICNAYPLASFGISDAAASTATAERNIRRPKAHGTVTDITFTGAAIAADNTDYITVTIAKRDGAGGAAVTLGTYDSRAANQGAITAFVPASFALSAVAGALFLLETDVVTITIVKGGSGKVLTGEFLVNGKVI